MTSLRPNYVRAIYVALLVATSGCSEPALIAERDGGSGGLDARVARPRTDECGNGFDDDGNGRIDDGCPCAPGEMQACYSGARANRDVGSCTDGVQTCRVTGSTEWGDWGDTPCAGATTPAAEQCDGLDHDCDGARDEDCPCSVGATQQCGLELLTAPCHGGRQTCSAAGTWGGCDGAVLPSPDVCDGTDNDCDGTADEGCGCMPEPEICRDARDNDCDGEIDEPACMPDWPLDGGVPGTDAGPGSDSGTPPLDGGVPMCGTSCVAEPGAAIPLTPFAGPEVAGYGNPFHIAANDTTTWIAVNRNQLGSFATRLTVIRAAPDGTVLGESEVSVTAATLGADIVAVGAGAVVVWGTQSGSSSTAGQFALVDATGVVSVPIDLDPGFAVLFPFVTVGDGELAFVWTRPGSSATDYEDGTELRFQRRHLDGTPAAPSVSLGTNTIATGIAPLRNGYVVGSRYRAPDFARVSQVRYVLGDAVTWEHDLPMREARWDGGAVVATSCDRALVCWRSLIDRPSLSSRIIDRCTVLDPAGMEVAAPFDLATGVRYGNNWEYPYIDAVWAGGRFVVYVERTFDAASTSGAVSQDRYYVQVSPAGTVDWRHAIAFPGAGYPYGDIAWGGGCVVSIEQGMDMVIAGMSGMGTSAPLLRRMCAATCSP